MTDLEMIKIAGWKDLSRVAKRNVKIGAGLGGTAIASGLAGGAIGSKKGKKDLAKKFNAYNKKENSYIANKAYQMGKNASDEFSAEEEFLLSKIAEEAFNDELDTIMMEKEAGKGWNAVKKSFGALKDEMAVGKRIKSIKKDRSGGAFDIKGFRGLQTSKNLAKKDSRLAKGIIAGGVGTTGLGATAIALGTSKKRKKRKKS